MSDVAVIGAGIVGTAVARELAVRGVAVTLLDRAGIAEATTGRGEGNVLCSDKDAGPELELTTFALDVYDEIDARLRDLSRRGALVECQSVPPVGTELLFTRGNTSIPARVAWSGADRVGLEFAYMIDEQEVLVQLKRTSCDQNQPRFRRARLFGEAMSDHEKKLARLWGASVGIALPGE